MPTYTYPVARPEGTLTTAQIHLLLSNPTLIAKRVAELSDQRFIADYLLTGRFSANGGGVFYETGEEIFAADTPQALAPGAEYPKTVMTRGELAAAKTVKWGLDTEIYDEAIARLGQNPVDRGVTRLSNSVIKNVDAVAWAVIAAKATDTAAATGAWTTVAAVVQTLLNVAAARADLGLGLNLDTVVLSGAQHAKVMGLFASANVLPREANGNPLVDGSYPANLLGYTWVTSPHVSGTDPWLIDRDQLGGMADEDLGSPGYVREGEFGIETKVWRLDGNSPRDGYGARARRVTVPVVTEPKAAIRITGTGL